MIPLCLVTGFLGAGKTSLLRHLARTDGGLRTVFVVNEFSQADVDGVVLASETENVLALPGGSIFCTCLAGEFIRVLSELPGRFGAPAAPVARVVVEASGMANPLAVARQLVETRLDTVYRLARVVAVTDPATLPTLLKTLPNIAAQIKASDLVLLNKADLHEEAHLARMEHLIREIQPNALFERTTHGRSRQDLFAEITQERNPGALATGPDPRYASVYAVPPGPVRFAALDAALAQFGGALLRAKGFITTTDGIVYVDRAHQQRMDRPARPPAAPAGLVLIVEGASAGDAVLLKHRLEAGAFSEN